MFLHLLISGVVISAITGALTASDVRLGFLVAFCVCCVLVTIPLSLRIAHLLPVVTDE